MAFWDSLKNFFTGVKEFNIGKSGEFQRHNRFEPNQLEALNNILSLLSGGQQTGNFAQSPFAQAFGQGQQHQPLNFEPIANQARRGFQQNTVPLLAERFASLGGSGTARSSGLFGALGSAGANLESNLAGQRTKYDFLGQQYQNQANAQKFNQAMQALQLGLTPQFENSYFPGTQGIIQQGIGAVGQLAPFIMGLL
jgi:hypothetical protein